MKLNGGPFIFDAICIAVAIRHDFIDTVKAHARAPAFTRLRAFFLWGSILFTPIWGLMPSSVAESSEMRVYTTYLAFAPEAIQISVGDSVTWVNDSGVMHEIYFPINPTDSSEQRLDYVLTGSRSLSIIVTKPGEYDYFCRWHGMHGSIHVVQKTPP